jgi:energy-converting hydrogenase Eha subunit E
MPLRLILIGTALLAGALIVQAVTDSPVASIAVMAVGVVLLYLRYEHRAR